MNIQKNCKTFNPKNSSWFSRKIHSSSINFFSPSKVELESTNLNICQTLFLPTLLHSVFESLASCVARSFNFKLFLIFLAEVVRAMNYCIEKGWVQYWGRLRQGRTHVFPSLFDDFVLTGTSKWSTTEIMEAYTNCREFNCVTPIMEQSEYHMFCRDRAELYLPEMYNKIGVGMMAWGPLGMYLTDSTERLFFSKGSLRSKTQNSSWAEDEVAREVRNLSQSKVSLKSFNLFFFSENFRLGSSWGSQTTLRKNSWFKFISRKTRL